MSPGPICPGLTAGRRPWGVNGLGQGNGRGRRRDQATGVSVPGPPTALDALLHHGIEHIHAHNTALTDRFRAHLDLPPTGSAITTIDPPDATPTLRRAGIQTTERQGRTRLSFHLYNTETEVDLAAKTLTT